MEGKIAIEEHFSTKVNNQYWDAKGESGRNGLAYTKDIESRLLDPDMCLRDMDRAGIEICVLSLTSPGVQGIVDPAKANEVAAASNDYAASLIRKHPDRFSAFAAVPLQNTAFAVAELRRAVSELDLRGVLVNGYTNRAGDEDIQYLDAEPLREFWAAVSELDVPLYLHPREPLPSQTRSIQGYPELGGSAWAFTYETSSHALRLMLSGLFDDLPNLKVLLGHLGEGLPFILPRMQHRLDEQFDGERGSKAKRRPSYYFANNFWLTSSGHHHTKPLMEAINELGEDHILFSVDYPYEQMRAASQWFDEAQIPDGVKAKVGRENAANLFKLKVGAATSSSVASSGS